jgi:N6-L-threonylcarbamoyladenine synthase
LLTGLGSDESALKSGQQNQKTTLPTSRLADLLKFPCIGLLVSGGHSDLLLFKSPTEYDYLGGTRDDASGECFDKCARLIGYPYPGGPKISQIGAKGNPKAYPLPRPMLDSEDFDFSFSGLKTAFSNLVHELFPVAKLNEEDALNHWRHIVKSDEHLEKDEQTLADLCASLELAITESLTKKTIKAAKLHGVEHIMIAGGVAANKRLVELLKTSFAGTLHSPEIKYCMDNGAMVAAAGFFFPATDPLSIQANPNLHL